MYHSNKTHRAYKKQYKNSDCPFCSVENNNRHKVKEFDNFMVIKNGVKYDYWEGHHVLEHFLLIPKKHIISLSELNDNEAAEMIKIAAGYEKNGYSIYARGVNSVMRSIDHQHTHMIKIDKKDSKAILFIQKPYILFKF